MDESPNFEHFYKKRSQKFHLEQHSEETITEQTIIGKGNVSKEYTNPVSLNNTQIQNNAHLNNTDMFTTPNGEFTIPVSFNNTQIQNHSQLNNNDMFTTPSGELSNEYKNTISSNIPNNSHTFKNDIFTTTNQFGYLPSQTTENMTYQSQMLTNNKNINSMNIMGEQTSTVNMNSLYSNQSSVYETINTTKMNKMLRKQLSKTSQENIQLKNEVEKYKVRVNQYMNMIRQIKCILPELPVGEESDNTYLSSSSDSEIADAESLLNLHRGSKRKCNSYEKQI